MALTQNVKKEAKKVGFVTVGISNTEMLRDLPYGKISDIAVLKKPEEELAGVKSVILMGIHAWDSVFDIVADSSNLHLNREHKPKVPLESYQLYSQVAKNRAWTVAHFLEKKGFDSIPSGSIPLKTAAIKCGLGCQGKNTLLITPVYGPRVRLVSVLTTADLDTDAPFREDLCKNCERCVLACPARAIEPYRLKVNKCMVYAAEKPSSKNVPNETRELEKRYINRPTPNSLIECTTCLEACPIGKPTN